MARTDKLPIANRPFTARRWRAARVVLHDRTMAKHGMTEPQAARRFPRDHAFVVQIDADADPMADCVIGRVEHVASGDAVYFSSAGELLAFFARTLACTTPTRKEQQP